MTELVPVGAWIRVSSDSQREESQIPDIQKHCDDRNYHIAVPWYILHDVKAFTGEQDAKIAEMLDDIRTGRIKVLVIWHSDRLERRGGRELINLIAAIHEAGGRIESVKEPSLGQQDMGGQLMTFISGVQAYEESKHKSDRVLAARALRKANNALTNRPPVPYRVTGIDCGLSPCTCQKGKDFKTLTVDPVIGPVFIQAIDHYIADGWSLRVTCEWLESHGVWSRGIAGKPETNKWHPRALSKAWRNPALYGRMMNMERTETALRIADPLITHARWLELTAKLDGRTSRKGIAPSATAMLTSSLFCMHCEGPMYRIMCSWGKTKTRYPCYRCHGTARQPSKCSNLIPLADLDQRVSDMITDAYGWQRHTTRVLVPGTRDHAEEIAGVRQDIRELDPEADEYDATLASLRADLARLRALPSVPDSYQERPTGQTVAQHWAALDTAGRRAWLRERGWKIYAARDGDGAIRLDVRGSEYFADLESMGVAS